MDEVTQYKGFAIALHWPYDRPFNPDVDDMDVYVTNPKGDKYVGVFSTLSAVLRDIETKGFSHSEGNFTVQDKYSIVDVVKFMIDGFLVEDLFEESRD